MNARDNKREQRFTTVYETYVDEIYGFVYTRTGLDKLIAEELTQDIFLAVYKGLDGYKKLSSMRTWIYGLTKNKLNDFYRSQYRKRQEIYELDDADLLCDPKQDITNQIQREYESGLVRECLEKLPKQYRFALTMKYIENMSIKEIASAADISAKAAESLLQRAKAAFIRIYNSLEGNDYEKTT